MPHVLHNSLSGTGHFARRDAHERWRRDYLEKLARHHAKRLGLSLPVACRIVTALSIAANKPESEGPARISRTERTPTLNAATKITAEEDALMRVLAAKGLHAGTRQSACEIAAAGGL